MNSKASWFAEAFADYRKNTAYRVKKRGAKAA